MKVETITVLVAENENEAKILAGEFNRLYAKHGTKAGKIWRLTLPQPGGKPLGSADRSYLERL